MCTILSTLLAFLRISLRLGQQLLMKDPEITRVVAYTRLIVTNRHERSWKRNVISRSESPYGNSEARHWFRFHVKIDSRFITKVFVIDLYRKMDNQSRVLVKSHHAKALILIGTRQFPAMQSTSSIKVRCV